MASGAGQTSADNLARAKIAAAWGQADARPLNRQQRLEPPQEKTRSAVAERDVRETQLALGRADEAQTNFARTR